MKIVIARDIRNSSENLFKAFADYCVSRGVEIHDLGLVSVDVVYFATGKYGYDGGIMVTASHNPGSYGGFKMVYRGAEWIRGKDLLDIFDEQINFEDANGKIAKIDIWSDYLDFIFSFVDTTKIKPMKIVVDAGNGMAGVMIPRIAQRLPQINLIPLFFESDGNFPNRNPNPLADGACDKLSKKVLEEKAVAGFIFDADSDRMFMVDEKGIVLKGDQVIMILAKQILEKISGAGIVYNLISSKNAKEFIERNGGRAIRSEVGYANMGRHMQEENGVMGGELSAHFSFKENYYSDCAFAAFLIALEAISEENFILSEFIEKNTHWHRSDEINVQVESIPEKLNLIRNHYKENIYDEIDGITVEFPDWWFNVRGSNTEPLLRITIEVLNIEDREKRKIEVLNILQLK